MYPQLSYVSFLHYFLLLWGFTWPIVHFYSNTRNPSVVAYVTGQGPRNSIIGGPSTLAKSLPDLINRDAEYRLLSKERNPVLMGPQQILVSVHVFGTPTRREGCRGLIFVCAPVITNNANLENKSLNLGNFNLRLATTRHISE
jgi:hypothetical protein